MLSNVLFQTYAHPGGSIAPREETTLDNFGLHFISRAIAVLEGRGRIFLYFEFFDFKILIKNIDC